MMSQAQEFESCLEEQLSRWLGAIPILVPILQRLNLVGIINRYCPCGADVDSGTVALILALNRLMAPRPLYKVAHWMAETILEQTLGIPAEKLHDRRIGELLDAIHPHIDSIWKELVHQAIDAFGIRLDFIHYDITSIYFEGAYEESELLEYGYSRDHRSDCKQVNLGLNVSGQEGLPLAFRVLQGSTSDRSTPLENMASLQDLLAQMPASHNFVLVTDQAMMDRDVILYYHQHDIGYLGPLPMLKEYEEVLMSVSTSQLKQYPLDYRPKRQKEGEDAIYYGILASLTIQDKPKKEQMPQSVQAQVLILYSTQKAKMDADKRNTLLNRYLARLQVIQSHLNQRKYKKADYAAEQIHKAQSEYASVKSLVEVQLRGEEGNLELSFQVNPEQEALAQERDGRYLLGTNRPLSADQMLCHFKEQDTIEKCNRVLKGPIRIRPMFLHKQERIESLIFICMVALLVFSILELLAKRAGIERTAQAILEQFQTLTVVVSHFQDGSQWTQLGPLTPFQIQFLREVGMPTPEIYLKHIKRE